MHADGPRSSSGDQVPAGGWMVPALLGPFQALRENAETPRQVLLLELAPERAESLARALEARGHTVRIARAASEVLELVGPQTPDLVLLGTSRLDCSAFARALQEIFARGGRPLLLTDTDGPEEILLQKLLVLLELR